MDEGTPIQYPKPKSIGIFASGYKNISILAGEIRVPPRSWRDGEPEEPWPPPGVELERADAEE